MVKSKKEGPEVMGDLSSLPVGSPVMFSLSDLQVVRHLSVEMPRVRTKSEKIIERIIAECVAVGN